MYALCPDSAQIDEVIRLMSARVGELSTLAAQRKAAMDQMTGEPEVRKYVMLASRIRTCKYRPNYPSKPFQNVDEARQWTLQFVQWYNHQHKHSGLKFVTPAQRHDGSDTAILLQREQVYAAARERRPKRWSGATRDWKLKDEVWLNPERDQPVGLQKEA